MSSRSKDKMAAAIRKFFKSPDKKEKAAQKDKGGDGAASGPAGDPMVLAVAGAIVPSGSGVGSAAGGGGGVGGSGSSSNHHSHHHYGGGGGAGSGSGNASSKTNGTDSPMRRLRCSVAPSTTSLVPMTKPLDTTIRSRRLMKELKEIERLQHSRAEPYFTVELVNDNLYEWHARLYRLDPDSPLAEDLVELGIPFILLHLVFPDNFPFAPPFMRVVEPRIEKGFVMEGGAICMELLTPRGWASAYTVEAVLMQFAASLVKGQGRVSRKPKATKEFSRRTAEEAFRSLVKTHEKYGWVTPAMNDG
ncbi:ubiquitin-conjugating enzyme E2Q-like protein 1 [Culex quinquefasciatus]|uniref:ubiquitin-conjugating enzyme E2Q-like protein 1 n=1 Tax=Culex quinquefasciatus TaxID=7176 RepID=UPI0018E29E9E|nr:ubiquitin-conjugating enzyme E2Q-like protein 1 [Culex quinquefasciatus]XP_038109268.1 ubiquitin-conjugating enzyme E2Q-like protein 1 [Culex quinquefasciatus]